MTPTMARAIGNAIAREKVTGNPALVLGGVQTITALARRGWVSDARYWTSQGEHGIVTDGSGALTAAGRDAYSLHVRKDEHPATAKQIEALRWVRSIAQDPALRRPGRVQGSLHPRVFGPLRRRGWIAWDLHEQDYRLTEAGAAVLGQAEAAGR